MVMCNMETFKPKISSESASFLLATLCWPRERERNGDMLKYKVVEEERFFKKCIHIIYTYIHTYIYIYISLVYVERDGVR